KSVAGRAAARFLPKPNLERTFVTSLLPNSTGKKGVEKTRKQGEKSDADRLQSAMQCAILSHIPTRLAGKSSGHLEPICVRLYRLACGVMMEWPMKKPLALPL